jgi:hypothetical protein
VGHVVFMEDKGNPCKILDVKPEGRKRGSLVNIVIGLRDGGAGFDSRQGQGFFSVRYLV